MHIHEGLTLLIKEYNADITEYTTLSDEVIVIDMDRDMPDEERLRELIDRGESLLLLCESDSMVDSLFLLLVHLGRDTSYVLDNLNLIYFRIDSFNIIEYDAEELKGLTNALELDKFLSLREKELLSKVKEVNRIYDL